MEKEDNSKLLKKAVPVITEWGVMTALWQRGGNFKVTTISHDYFLQTINTPKILPYHKNNMYKPKENLVIFELEVIK